MLSATFKGYHTRIGLSRSFLNRFSNLRRSPRGFASAATLIGYHIRRILSRLFFRDSTVRLETLASFCRAVRNSLLRIPETVGNVNRFFHFFGYQLLFFLMTVFLAFCFANKGALFTAAVPCYTINIVSAQPQYCPTQEGSF